MLENVRRWYGMSITGYVIMPEHVHLLVGEPERTRLSTAIQMLKQNVARELGVANGQLRFWQRRYYDFNVWTEAKRIEKLRYLHRNPVNVAWWQDQRTGNGVVFGIGQRELKAWLKSSRNGLLAKENGWAHRSPSSSTAFRYAPSPEGEGCGTPSVV